MDSVKFQTRSMRYRGGSGGRSTSAVSFLLASLTLFFKHLYFFTITRPSFASIDWWSTLWWWRATQCVSTLDYWMFCDRIDFRYHLPASKKTHNHAFRIGSRSRCWDFLKLTQPLKIQFSTHFSTNMASFGIPTHSDCIQWSAKGYNKMWFTFERWRLSTTQLTYLFYIHEHLNHKYMCIYINWIKRKQETREKNHLDLSWIWYFERVKTNLSAFMSPNSRNADHYGPCKDRIHE